MLAMSPRDPRTTQTTTATANPGREDHPTISALEKEGEISFPEKRTLSDGTDELGLGTPVRRTPPA
jgi:hypothetical protein